MLLSLMFKMGVSCIKSTWMVFKCRQFLLCGAELAAASREKGWSGSALLRLICQWFAGSANTQCWALVGRAVSCSRRDLVNGVREGAEHQSCLPLVYRCSQRIPRSPQYPWLVSFLLWFTGDPPSLHQLPGCAFLLPDVSLCMFSLQGSEWNASNLEDLQNRG